MNQRKAWDIRLENLKVGYEDKVVLERVDAVLPGGKISVILGGSGCGKSTLLRHILGLSRPLAGHVYIGGRDFFNQKRKEFRAFRRQMGVLFQDGALLGSMTLGENVALPLKEHTNLSPPIIDIIVRTKLSLVGLEPFVDYYPTQLSGGMRKRAGLARAIATDPPLLLCDEPTSGLDPINSAQMDQLMLELKDAFPHMTTVVVSHDLQSLLAIADFCLVLAEGRVAFQGGLEELRGTKDPYLRQFLDRKAGDRDVPDVASLSEVVRKGRRRDESRAESSLDASANSNQTT